MVTHFIIMLLLVNVLLETWSKRPKHGIYGLSCHLHIKSIRILRHSRDLEQGAGMQDGVEVADADPGETGIRRSGGKGQSGRQGNTK